MRWASLFIASWMTVSTSQAPAAQVGTAEGVAALARGDFQRAAAILKPIAEGWGQPDPMAQFLMGTLYETGQGVPQDLMRACALYQRATGAWGTPFGEEAGRLFKALIFSHDGEWNQDCQMLANIGFDHGFEPVTLTLTPGHSVAWDLKGATVTYQGKSTRFPMQFASRGTIFLPIRQTDLASGDPAAPYRYFNEVLLWRPSEDRRWWSLEWHLFEVVRDQLITIGVPADFVVRLQATEPPDPRSFDVRAYVDVRRTLNGGAEWRILQGPHMNGGNIASDAERREVRELAAAREAADKRVDWDRKQSVHRPPSMAYADANGCGGILVYGWSNDHAEAITVRADRELLGLTTAPGTFDVARQGRSLDVVIHMYAVPRRSSDFCSDATVRYADSDPYGLEEVWRAVSGTITIELSPPGVRPSMPFLYRAALRLTNAEFVNRSGVRVRQTQPIVLSAIVGGFHGN